ncbi:MAG: sulfotransferase, partial [Pseudomonadota bacterium]
RPSVTRSGSKEGLFFSRDSADITHMRYPNLLLVGVQKSGTTWIHQALSGSRHIFGSTPKELNLWGKADYLARLDEYRARFPAEAKPGARYFLESTPHYFHAPNVLADVARQIRDTIDDVRIVVILRNPVERYRSAYVHHMRKGRLPFTERIDRMTDEQIMLSTGLYGKILDHWKTVFPDIVVLSYEKLRTDPFGLIQGLFAELGLDCDLGADQLGAPVHTSEQKRTGANWPVTPKLTPELTVRLIEYYREDVMHLSGLVDFDVTGWLDQRG